MADLELANAGLARVRSLHLRDHAPTLVAQRPRFVQRLDSPWPHEAAVALDERQVIGEHRGEVARQRLAVGFELRSGPREFGRQIVCAFEKAHDGVRRGDPVADRGEVARAAAVEAQARQRPQEIGRASELPSQRVPDRRRFDEPVERQEPLVDDVGVGQRSGEPLSEQARASRRDGEVDGRDERALPRAGERPGELQGRARRSVDLEV